MDYFTMLSVSLVNVHSVLLRYYLVVSKISSRLPDNKLGRVRMELQFSSILTLLGSGHQNLHETYQCRMYSTKLLMKGGEDARNI
jgi:hypothetical protein